MTTNHNTIEILSNATFVDERQTPVVFTSDGNVTLYQPHYAERELMQGQYFGPTKDESKRPFDEHNTLIDIISICEGKHGKMNYIAFQPVHCYVVQHNDTKKITLVHYRSMGTWDMKWKTFATQT